MSGSSAMSRATASERSGIVSMGQGLQAGGEMGLRSGAGT
jgi:hypothetical protein